MCAAIPNIHYVPDESRHFSIMLEHLRGAQSFEEISYDIELFVEDLGYSRRDANEAARQVAEERGWV